MPEYTEEAHLRNALPVLYSKLIRLRRRILLPHGEGRGTSAEKLNRKRHLKNLVRRWYRRWRTSPPLHERLRGLPAQVLVSRYRPNPIADVLLSDRQSSWKPIHRRNREPLVIGLKDFSFIDNPRGTCELLKMLARSEAENLSVRVNFDDEGVSDLASYVVLGELWQGLTPVFVGGRISLPVQKVIDAVGLREFLQMAPFRMRQSPAGMWALPLQRRVRLGQAMSPERQLGPQKREKVADAFCDWIDRCLGVPEIDQQLTNDGKAWIARLVGELLDNAERHSSLTPGDGVWSIAGFMSKTGEPNGSSFMLSMAILSVGRSISQSLESADPKVEERLRSYVNLHRGSGLDAGTLRTVVALQDYVTRVSQASKDARGGGYPSDLLAQAPLKWLMDKAALHGLHFRENFIVDPANFNAPIADSYSDFYRGWRRPLRAFDKPFYRTVGAVPEVGTERTTSRINETIDASVFERWQNNSEYRPRNLQDWAARFKVDPGQMTTPVLANDPSQTV